jgi:hypothetical protein
LISKAGLATSLSTTRITWNHVDFGIQVTGNAVIIVPTAPQDSRQGSVSIVDDLHQTRQLIDQNLMVECKTLWVRDRIIYGLAMPIILISNQVPPAR